jgi:hypothetical protein
MMRIELDIDEIKEAVAIILSVKYNLEIKKCNFTYDLVDFDESLFGMTCEVYETKGTK